MKLKEWLQNWIGKQTRKHRLVDSGYGRIPAEAGPSEGICVRLIPVDKSKRSSEKMIGQTRRSK